MNRTANGMLFAAALAFGALLLLPAGCGEAGGPAPAPAKGANVLFILIDSLRSDHLDCYGYERPTAPFLAQMAQEGVLFEEVCAPCSWTKPSVASLFTSQFPSQHGVLVGNCRDTEDNFVSDVLPSSLPTMAEFFQRSDYATFAAIRNSHLKAFMGFSKGFDSFHEIMGGGKKIVDKFEAWINNRGEDGRPFFAYLHFLDVHSYNPPASYRELFGKPDLKYFKLGAEAFMKFREDVKKGRATCPEEEQEGLRLLYDAEVRYLDDLMKSIAEFLKEKGLWSNTLFVLTSDHGEEFFEHGEFAHGHSMADNLLRIPLVLRLPGSAFAGTTIPAPMDLLDLPPTLMDLCGVPYPEGELSGVSLANQVLQGGASGRDRYRYGELYRENPFDGYFLTQSLRSRDFHFLRTYRTRKGMGPKLMERVKNSGKRSVFAASLRRDHAGCYEVEEKLFDLRTDPGEFKNAALDNPEITSKMGELLDGIDQLLCERGAADGGQVILDPDTIEDLRRTGYIR